MRVHKWGEEQADKADSPWSLGPGPEPKADTSPSKQPRHPLISFIHKQK